MSISKSARPSPARLTTARLTLRGPRAEDAVPLHRAYGDAGTMRYWSTLPDATLADTEARVARQIAGFAKAPSYFVIERDGEVIGNAGGSSLSPTGREEVGFILVPQAIGHGYAREAMAALIPYLFDTLGAQSLWADVDPRNAASIRCLTSLGFVESGRAERTFLIGDDWVDSIYFERGRTAAS